MNIYYFIITIILIYIFLQIIKAINKTDALVIT